MNEGQLAVLRQLAGDAMRRGNQVPVVAYLQAGGDPNGFIDDGQPLIHLALEYPAAFREDRSGIIRWLVKSGVDPDSREESGVPPLSYCKYPGEVSALLDLGADVNARDFEDWTALMYVSGRTHSLALTRLLLRRGADLTMTARCGSDAMSLAVGVSDAKVADLLAEVTCAGSWANYARAPRIELVRLRTLCTRGRATPPPDPVFMRLFGAPPKTGARVTRRAVRVKNDRPLPNEVFWHILGYWRSSRDAEDVVVNDGAT